MKHLSDTDAEYFGRLIELSGIELLSDQMVGVLEHLDWVLEQGRTMNITAIRDPRQAVRLHAIDSLSVLSEVRGAATGEMLDLGTGAGYPGVPLAIATGRQTILVDSVGKKAAALARFLEGSSVSPSVRVISARAEEIPRRDVRDVTVVVARAVAALPALVELAAPLLINGGVPIAMKGALEEEELARGDAVGKIVAMKRDSLRRYLLPEGDEVRSVVVYRRSGSPSIDLPRRVGFAQRRPLA